MDRSLAQTAGLFVLTFLLTFFVARLEFTPRQHEAAGQLPADTASDTTIKIHWLDDPGILSAFSAINGRQIAAGEQMLSTWHSDTVRDLAIGLVQAHSAMQRSADSIAQVLEIVPVPSALNTELVTRFQSGIDSLFTYHSGWALDRAYVAQQAESHRLMAGYLTQLAAASTSSDLRAWLQDQGKRVNGLVARVQGQQQATAASDSLAGDSLTAPGMTAGDSIGRRARRKKRPAADSAATHHDTASARPPIVPTAPDTTRY